MNRLYEDAMAFQNRCENAYHLGGGVAAAQRVLERTLPFVPRDRYEDKNWLWMRGYEMVNGKVRKINWLANAA